MSKDKFDSTETFKSDISQTLQALCTKRSSIKGQITKFKNYLSNLASKPMLNPIEFAELNLKLGKFETLSNKFDDLQSQIEVFNSNNLAEELDERDDIEQLFIGNIAFGQSVIQRSSNVRNEEVNRDLNSSHISTQCSLHHQHEVSFKLPQIQINKFDGTYFRWLEFRDTYISLIHNNERILPIHKFHYLASYLEGDAARIICNLEVASANYENAWALLCERYDNKRLLITHHLNSLLNISTFNRESERSLRFMVDHVAKNLRALSSLHLPTDQWDVLIIHIMCTKLDSQTLSKWEEHRNSLDNIPDLKQFNKFLVDRADVLESINRNKIESNSKPTIHLQKRVNNFQTKSFITSSQEGTHNTIKCVVCKGEHRIYDCPIFKAKNIDERRAEVTKLNLCLNCLRPGHSARTCHLGPCRECKRRHNTLIHVPIPFHTADANASDNVNSTHQSSISAFAKQHNEVFLSTVLIDVCNPLTNVTERVRALLDCGSQSSFITRSLQQRLSIIATPINTLNIVGIGNFSNNQVTESCQANLISLQSSFSLTYSFLILDELTGKLPKSFIDVSQFYTQLKNFKLADPKFNQPAEIDVLLGADIFWDILGCEQHALGPKLPKLRSSQFGWLITGPIYSNSTQLKTLQCHATTNNKLNSYKNLDKQIAKFWELEELPERISFSESEQECENHFVSHTTRLSSGRFCVRLPLKGSPDCLGESYNLAKRRLLSLEKRFHRQPNVKLQYFDFIQEYTDLKHLSISSILKPEPSYFLCHHAVFKNSESTQTRVVFDGSAPTTSGYSINDILMTGPNMQDSLLSILIRARQYKYVLTGDIEKMYRQVQVHEDDQNLQLILWRNDETEPVQTLKLGTVTYGLTSSSYLSTRCLWQLGEECHDPTIKTVIQHDFYIDDLYTGCDSIEELKYIYKSVVETLKHGCFNLRKFKSNIPFIFNLSKSNNTDKLITSESSSTLGMGWNPDSDSIHFTLKIPTKNDVITKRYILSSSFKIFDPMGLLSPCIILPKIWIQSLWLQKIGWDEPVPQTISTSWVKFLTALPSIAKLSIPRLVFCSVSDEVELHSFCDASQSAYGACIYARSVDADNHVTVRLLCAKSKVAPIKATTIPRLELCAALLAAKLCKIVQESMRNKSIRFYHWSDSTVVLGWLKTSNRDLKTFVANRVAEICSTTNSSLWRYVPTALNPADLISRGVYPDQIKDCHLWWCGPKFLSLPEAEWPILKSPTDCDLPELKANIATASEPFIVISNYSNFNKLRRSFAYVLRFVNNAKNPNSKVTSTLTVDELYNSFCHLARLSQLQSFASEYDLLSKGKGLSPKSSLLSLTPFFDNKLNIIRVGGRIDASEFNYNKRHPILLHASDHFTKLFFDHEHKCNLHAGPQLLLALVRETVWPINGRHLARRTVFNCVVCRRHQGRTTHPLMGNLPKQRLTVDFPFNTVGIDFAGPFYIMNRKGRGARVIKCYLCLFICLRYKCIHLEATSDLTKDAFIMTFRRFAARRGKPSEVFCDNGRNFVATAKEFGKFIKINKASLSDFASQEGIKFFFSPSYAPHFGGIWEAGVKSAKHHIKRVMGNSHLTFEELTTLFAQVEAILNSRPMCPLSPSPNEMSALTPGHFLIGRPLTALPLPPIVEQGSNEAKRYARMEKIRQHFWDRWRNEYVSQLQQRTKWKKNTCSLKLGDMVLLKEDQSPPLCWRLGLIEKLYAGPDNISRVADVKTTTGTFRRPFTRLCPLPTLEDYNG